MVFTQWQRTALVEVLGSMAGTHISPSAPESFCSHTPTYTRPGWSACSNRWRTVAAHSVSR